MLVSDQRPPSDDWLVRRIADLERQVRELQAGPRLAAATIGAGGLRIVNGGKLTVEGGGSIELLGGGKLTVEGGGSIDVLENGAPRVQIGLLGDGAYGVSTVDADGDMVKLHTLAFGMRGISDSGGIDNNDVSSTSYADVYSSGELFSMPVTVGPSKRFFATWSIAVSPVSYGGFSSITPYCSPYMVGPSGQTANWGDGVALSVSMPTNMSYFSGSKSMYFDESGGVNEAGVWNVRLRVKVNAGSAFFSYPSLDVMPF